MSSNKPLEPNKTLVGIPGDFQAAVDKLRAQESASGEDSQRTRLGHPPEPRNAPAQPQLSPPPLPPNRPFQPPPGFAPAPPPAPMHHAPPPGRVQQAERTLLGMPNNLQAILRAADAAVAERAQREGRPAPEPSTQRHGSAPAIPARRGGLAGGAPRQEHQESRVHLHLDGADGDDRVRHAHGADAGMHATRMAPLELDDAERSDRQDEEEDATDVVRRPRLALSERTTHRTAQPARKLWPVVAAVAAVVLLAGGGWFAARWIHGDSLAQTDAPAAATPALPVAVKAPDLARGNTVTDVSAATQLDRAKPVVAAAPAQPTQPAQPVTLAGTPAELERQAIDLLIAKNYPAAAQAYERLRAAEPDNKAYAVMAGLLTRSETKSCGQPGQEPCATR